MNKRMRQNFMLVAFGILLYAAVMNLQYVFVFFRYIVNIFLPLLLGFTFAFVLSVPMNGLENIIHKICRRIKKTPKEKTVHALSLILTLLIIFFIILLVGKLVVPQILISVKSIGIMIKDKWPEWAAVLKIYHIDTKPITDWIENLKFEQLFSNLVSGASVLFDMVAGTAASTISMFATVAISLVIMFYVLLSKEELARQSKKMLYAYLKKEIADRMIHIACLTRNIFTRFLSGQCVEALILGILMFVAFSIVGLPYAGLIAMLTSMCAFIPYVGAFFSCAIGVLLMLISNPSQAILCFIVYQVVQFIENQFIYPHVVGNSVGLSPLWTLIAVLIGGKLFGLVGMVFFIPVVAVIYTLIRENMNKRLEDKKIKVE